MVEADVTYAGEEPGRAHNRNTADALGIRMKGRFA